MREYLKKLRIARGWSQQDVASKLGITRQYYSLIEDGERQKKMDITLIAKIAELFQLEVGQVVKEEQRAFDKEHETA